MSFGYFRCNFFTSLNCLILQLEGSKDFEKVFREMEESKICVGHSLLYEWYAVFLEAKGKWQEAHMVYQIGISRSLMCILVL